MKYSREQINKAGNILVTSNDEVQVQEAKKKVDEWRILHLPVLTALQSRIVTLLEVEKIDVELVSNRLKRMSSIEAKLDLNPQMRLGGVYDIAGLRVVVKDVNELDKVFQYLQNKIPDGFVLDETKTKNYVESPKTSGYRSIHLIYKCASDNNDINGMSAELQLRTKIQHNWATAIETAGLITNTQLKASKGKDYWLNSFKYMSSLFAIKEERPIMKEHQDLNLSMQDLMRELYRVNKDYKIRDKLAALRTTVNHAENNQFENGYYILNIIFEEQIVQIKSFSSDDKEIAYAEYSNIEKTSQSSKNAVVFVSVPKMKELREAYPSYFLDVSEFLKAFDKMMSNCEKYNLV